MSVETQVPPEWTEGFVEVGDGLRLHYTRTGGDGPPLVVAHGVFDDGRCRIPLARDLQDEYDVICYDARGHGESDAPDSGYSATDRVADLVGLLDELDVTDPILVGHSMGGDTVLATAAEHPNLPRAVVSVDPASLLANNAENRDDEDGLSEDDVEGVRQQILWWHDHSKAELLQADDEISGHLDHGNEELAGLLADARLRVSANITEVFRNGWLDPEDVFPAIEAPTLVLRSDVDEQARALDQEQVGLLTDGRLIHVEDAGHCIFRDQRAVATDELRSFLDGA